MINFRSVRLAETISNAHMTVQPDYLVRSGTERKPELSQIEESRLSRGKNSKQTAATSEFPGLTSSKNGQHRSSSGPAAFFSSTDCGSKLEGKILTNKDDPLSRMLQSPPSTFHTLSNTKDANIPATACKVESPSVFTPCTLRKTS